MQHDHLLKSQLPIRVLVVDDSAFMRKAISNMLCESSDFVIAGTAINGEDALRKVAAMDIDVMTLDIDMPGMDGLAVLEQVMAHHPLPVVIVSSLTEGGAAVTIRALELGAVDFIFKHLGGSSLKISEIRVPLQEKVRAAATARSKIQSGSRQPVVPRALRKATPPFPFSSKNANTGNPDSDGGMQVNLPGDPGVLIIGCSTGGPQALQVVLTLLPSTFPYPIVVAQHMPKFFTKPFAERLDQLCALEVAEAQEGDHLKPGRVLIAPGGQHLTLERRGHVVMTHVSDHPKHLPYRPSVDLLMESAAKLYGQKVVGLVMTGMGQDGLEGARAIKRAGGSVLAQDEASSIVYGMPKAVADHGIVDKVVSLQKISTEIQLWVKHQSRHDSADTVLVGLTTSHS
ncbi:chemotaxis response regulator protein-glutamate methylesterase [Candidatus Nitronereus thalassa]|uniref:Protein-glutamate methylesterase/protein-glutamine glutaminase n=1 Tax=Candidatus Nitronereus thalassa TaxID=3020898 RepID=A0ABU3K671_9BACT|nr:chemotaxis response regulator protein-glutamate methylesterase [Candidatus Nitronereus thalassa]MDT7041874.1 chemotaxis response regulator protein-glutamate methylesterase [Candidatus Nitronereus thalassa]